MSPGHTRLSWTSPINGTMAGPWDLSTSTQIKIRQDPGWAFFIWDEIDLQIPVCTFKLLMILCTTNEMGINSPRADSDHRQGAIKRKISISSTTFLGRSNVVKRKQNISYEFLDMNHMINESLWRSLWADTIIHDGDQANIVVYESRLMGFHYHTPNKGRSSTWWLLNGWGYPQIIQYQSLWVL